MLQYRKMKDGAWAVFGPVGEMKVGTVTVHKKSGETKAENVVKVSAPFTVDGKPHCYGYIDEQRAASSSGNYDRSGERRYERKWCRCDNPLDEGDGECMYCGYQIK